MVSTKVFSTLMVVLIMMNVSSNHHIRINSEGPCDTDDWNNDAENSDITGIITF